MRIALTALMLGGAAPERGESVSAWRFHVEDASAQFGIPASWIERVMRAESRGRTTWNGRPIVSRAGAMGLMQLMPGTWADMRARLGLGHDPHAPRDNIMAGAFYLRLMYDRFGYPGLFAAYNAGPARYAEHLATGKPLPLETRNYLTSLAAGKLERRSGPSEQPNAKLFFRFGEAEDSVEGGIFIRLADLGPPRPQ